MLHIPQSFALGDPDNGRITGVKQRVTVGSKLSKLSGDPDYLGQDTWGTIVYVNFRNFWENVINIIIIIIIIKIMTIIINIALEEM
jgi:hypothetical protein